MAYLHIVPKYHRELFNSDEPQTSPHILRVIFGLRDENLNIDRLEAAWKYASDQRKKEFWEKYVGEIEIEGLEHILDPEEDQKEYFAPIIESIKNDGIKMPLLVITTSEPSAHWKEGTRIIIEGKHRAGISRQLGKKTVPAFLLWRAN